jgi:tRNA-splicing ligase RtcB
MRPANVTGIFGTHDENTLAQLYDIASRADRVALMADGHVGCCMPIGGVAAYKNHISVVGVGYDIACGNCAIKTDLLLSDLVPFTRADIMRNPYIAVSNGLLNRLADQIFSILSFGIGRKNESDDAPVDHPLFLSDAWYIIPNKGGYRDDLREKARKQLGTIGSGNHYVDVFADEEDYIWVGVHFGSRGFGHTIASNFLAISQGGTWGDRGKEVEVLLSMDEQTGKDYYDLMKLAGEYAYAGREWVTRKVVNMLGGKEMDLVHNHHNFAWAEMLPVLDTSGSSPIITQTAYYVVRKGATPAYPGQRGFIGGSMGDDAVIIQGAWPIEKITIPDDISRPYAHLHGVSDGVSVEMKPCFETQLAALFSTVHGAGRVLSRTEAAGKWKKGVQVKHGRISAEDRDMWLNARGIILRGAGLDEAPQAYRRLPDVLAAQGDSIDILHTLRPLIVCMAPANDKDPYKD